MNRQITWSLGGTQAPKLAGEGLVVSELNVLVLHLFNKVHKDPIFLVMRPQPS